MMQITENFTHKELVVTNTGYYNEPDDIVKDISFYLARYILEQIRGEAGVMDITSWYRSKQVNSIVGGASTSQHLLGAAADFIPREYNIDALFDWIVRDSGIYYGQVILETRGYSRWIHISLPVFNKRNKEALVFSDAKYESYHL